MNVQLEWQSAIDPPKDGHYPVLAATKNPRGYCYQTAWFSRMHNCWYAYPSDKVLRLDVKFWMEINHIPEPLEKTPVPCQCPMCTDARLAWKEDADTRSQSGVESGEPKP
jgi:hypothetical protein